MAETVWLFAKEFGWTAEYVLWEMSEAELNQLEHAILVNRGFNCRKADTKQAEKLVEQLLDEKG
jgi:hypothetical protein